MTDQIDDTPDPQDSAAPAETAVGEAPAAEADPLAALQRERDALQDRLLRTAAEFDNYRKRVERDRREQAESAQADALQDLLPIMDDLERALQAPAGDAGEAYRKGVELIYRQMEELLRKGGVKAMDVVGADFDPRYHQAVVHEVSTEHREGEVMAELRRGYLLGDRLLRPALVKVARG
ncbi:MAG: nucleotide exchange factor GrpE [Acidobacteria bacterium]|nr:nucleotide exchange factor GrpE [Acidobacteriota bacterium]